ncbi:MAG: DUF2976 domain-containing protein [Geminicoccaceae bacterium]
MNLKRPVQRLVATAVSTMIMARAAFAQVQIPDIAGDVGDQNDLIGTLNDLAIEGLGLALLLVGVLIFIVVGWAVIRKFYECVNGRAEWGEAGVTAAAGVAVLVLSGFILSLGNGVLAPGN